MSRSSRRIPPRLELVVPFEEYDEPTPMADEAASDTTCPLCLLYPETRKDHPK
jgi:hypothetical protein